MRIKTFYAKSMRAALRLIKDQLGPDALILSSREYPPAGPGRASNGFEVVAAVDDDGLVRQGPEADSLLLSGHKRAADRGDSRILRPEDTYAFSRPPIPSALETGEPDGAASLELSAPGSGDGPAVVARCTSILRDASVQEFHRLLLSREIGEPLASQLLEDACSSLRPEDRQSMPAFQRAVVSAACSRIMRPEPPDGLPGKRVVIFVGPTGVGKTTSIAKLAARLALKHRKKVVLLSLDGYRIGAVEQLKTYAGLMGMPFRFVPDVAELAQAIGECSQRDYILVDTIGHGPRNAGPVLELGRFLENFRAAECHLVMSATTKQKDIPEITSRFQCCEPDHLLFTKLDETTSLGPILNELVRTGKPARYYSDGQRVPEDFHVAPPERIVNLVLN
jgi:flagellar biosynthesis protein FlhF